MLGALVVADMAARGVTEDQLRQRMVSRVQASGSEVDGPAAASISSFPFLGRLLVSGTISEVDVSLQDVTVRGVTFASVGVELRAVRIDRDTLVQDQRVALESIGRGTAVVEISGDEVSRLLGVPIVLEEGRAGVRVGGSLVTVGARVEGGSLVVEAGGISLPVIEIPPLPLIACLEGAEILPGRLRLTCQVDRVPIELAGRSLDVQL
ncbi:MAG TPA: hypothetical protein VM942_08820 [Acidimicrobiales bacterium]|nr:hypothetical protein [Acidimicrobiales bacterium]